ncbi:MAG: VOC family protein [Rhizobiaceae bacterium]|nr:VOC family protein [Rhizobiaceae bacterium]MCV0405420.1 VOC family protein [Rhizobiaceae bacterium]
MKPANFFWYELVTTDPKAATGFYADVVGWTPVPYGPSHDYTVLNVGPDQGTAGIMATPPEAAGMPPQWMGYLYVDDVDAKAREVETAGGKVEKGPWDIPEIGRAAVCTDPHGAPFMIMKPNGEDRPPLPMTTPGTIGWRDLSAGDLDEAWSFYAGLFGWTKGDAIPMEGMGDYQLFHAGGDEPVGGMMTKTPDREHPFWLFYFVVPAIDAAREKIVKGGGTVVMEPMEVPGGAWAMEALDPQGARFGLTAASR